MSGVPCLAHGFANSVSLAQYAHRNLALWSSEHASGPREPVAAPEGEVRKDRPVTVANPSWRMYLDNYDLLEKVKAVDTGDIAVRSRLVCWRYATPRIRGLGCPSEHKESSGAESPG